MFVYLYKINYMEYFFLSFFPLNNLYNTFYIIFIAFRNNIIQNNSKNTQKVRGYYFEQSEFWMEQVTGWLYTMWDSALMRSTAVGDHIF